MKLTDQQIQEIADYLDAGLRCYVKKETKEIISIPDSDRWNGFVDESWEDELSDYDENPGNYWVLECMSSHDSFDVMADFAEIVDDDKLEAELMAALNRRKPFMNFKWIMDNSGEYRQKWFDFKLKRHIEWVKEQLEAFEEE